MKPDSNTRGYSAKKSTSGKTLCLEMGSFITSSQSQSWPMRTFARCWTRCDAFNLTWASQTSVEATVRTLMSGTSSRTRLSWRLSAMTPSSKFKLVTDVKRSRVSSKAVKALSCPSATHRSQAWWPSIRFRSESRFTLKSYTSFSTQVKVSGSYKACMLASQASSLKFQPSKLTRSSWWRTPKLN